MLKKVLILDHRSPWSHFAAGTLWAHSYDAIELRRLEEALVRLDAAPAGEEYTLVIVDSLSDRTEDNRVKPLEVARTIAERFPKVLLIVASSRPTPDEAARAYAAGASAYIPKTFDERQLMELVTQASHGGNPCS